MRHEQAILLPLGPIFRLSADPAAMAASCTLRAGQTAREETDRLNVAREMFHMVVINFPQPRYQYNVAQARLGLEQLDPASRAALSGLIMEGQPIHSVFHTIHRARVETRIATIHNGSMSVD